MSPSLHHGDVVVVNEAACEADLPGLYVLEEDGRLSVRRLHPARGRIHVSCDNPVWYAYDCLPEHLCLRGRIVWVSRVLH
jgi:phage repressor protein C with HTH and peptisase S24 domain